MGNAWVEDGRQDGGVGHLRKFHNCAHRDVIGVHREMPRFGALLLSSSSSHSSLGPCPHNRGTARQVRSTDGVQALRPWGGTGTCSDKRNAAKASLLQQPNLNTNRLLPRSNPIGRCFPENAHLCLKLCETGIRGAGVTAGPGEQATLRLLRAQERRGAVRAMLTAPGALKEERRRAPL